MRVVGCPPVAQRAVGVDLAALVVEAVRQFVADHAADRAVVDRRIGIRIEDRRLQDSGRKHDVAQRAVVGIVGLRRHAPVEAIDRPVQAADEERPVGRRGARDVADQIVVAHDDVRVVARMIRIADLDRVGFEFLQRFAAWSAALIQSSFSMRA